MIIERNEEGEGEGDEEGVAEEMGVRVEEEEDRKKGEVVLGVQADGGDSTNKNTRPEKYMGLTISTQP